MDAHETTVCPAGRHAVRERSGDVHEAGKYDPAVSDAMVRLAVPESRLHERKVPGPEQFDLADIVIVAKQKPEGFHDANVCKKYGKRQIAERAFHAADVKVSEGA